MVLCYASCVTAVLHPDRQYRNQFLSTSNPITSTIAGKSADQDMGSEGDATAWGSFQYYGADFFDATLGGPPASYGPIMDGTGTRAKFRKPADISGYCTFVSCDLYVVDSFDHKVRRLWVDAYQEYVVETIAGDGRNAFKDSSIGGAASFNTPSGIVVKGSPGVGPSGGVGSTAYVADRGNNRIRSVDLGTGSVTTVAGFNGAVGRYVRLLKANDNTGLQVADIKAFAPGGEQYTAVGTTMSTGDGSNCADNDINTNCQTDAGQQLEYQIQVDFGGQIDIWKIEIISQRSSPVFGVALASNLLINTEVSVCPNSTWTPIWKQTITTAEDIHKLYPNIPGGSHDNVLGVAASFNKPTGVTLSVDQNTLYVSEQGSVGHIIRKVDVSPGSNHSVQVWLGDVPGTWNGAGINARFNTPAGLVIDPNEPDVLYVADSANHQIRRVQISTSTTSQWAGDHTHGWDYLDGIGTDAKFGSPWGLTTHTINKCDGTRSRLMFVAEQGNHRIRVIDIDTVAVSTLTGKEYSGHVDGGPYTAQFMQPSGLHVAHAGGGARMIFVADSGNYAIRKVTASVTMPNCADVQAHASLSVSPRLPLGANLYVTLTIDTSYLGSVLGTAEQDWVGLYRAGECANADTSDVTALTNLHKCHLATKQISVRGLTTMTFVFSPEDYASQEDSYEVRYFTKNSGPNTREAGYVCAADLGKQGRVAIDGYTNLCWLDVYATSPVVEIGKNMYTIQAAPDRQPFNGIRKADLEQMVPGIEYESLA